mmetsp:Transcript_27200/g.84659  ORF Transcript_27200/g.84659 Transcript_27200/m.84659 type:complete len:378 (-) Transcript_27200:439-1572(-)
MVSRKGASSLGLLRLLCGAQELLQAHGAHDLSDPGCRLWLGVHLLNQLDHLVGRRALDLEHLVRKAVLFDGAVLDHSRAPLVGVGLGLEHELDALAHHVELRELLILRVPVCSPQALPVAGNEVSVVAAHLQGDDLGVGQAALERLVVVRLLETPRDVRMILLVLQNPLVSVHEAIPLLCVLLCVVLDLRGEKGISPVFRLTMPLQYLVVFVLGIPLRFLPVLPDPLHGVLMSLHRGLGHGLACRKRLRQSLHLGLVLPHYVVILVLAVPHLLLLEPCGPVRDLGLSLGAFDPHLFVASGDLGQLVRSPLVGLGQLHLQLLRLLARPLLRADAYVGILFSSLLSLFLEVGQLGVSLLLQGLHPLDAFLRLLLSMVEH